MSWRFGRRAGAYVLEVERDGREAAVSFDIDDVFARIPRDRLRDLVAGPNRLRLTVAPDVRAVPFDLRDGVVVIDIRDGPPDLAAPFERPLDPAPAWPAPRARVDGVTAALRGAGRLPSPAPGPLWPAPPRPPDAGDPARTLLLREVARAAAQGLVSPPRRSGASTRTPATERPGPPAAEGAASSAVELPAPEIAADVRPQGDHAVEEQRAQVQLRAQTVIDRDSFDAVRAALTPADPCAALPDTDVGAWGDGLPPAELLARRRAALLGEFDRADPEAVAELARAYLHLGFGAEARATLAGFAVQVPDSDVIAGLAAIMDDEAGPAGGRIAAARGCEGPAGLWALLAGAGAGEHPDAIVAAFSGLPAHLRRLLGPRTAGALMDEGLSDRARAVRNAVRRVPMPGGGPDPAAVVIDGRLALAARTAPPPRPPAGDANAGPPVPDAMALPDPGDEAALLDLVSADGPEAVEALRLYVEGRVAAGLPVPGGIAETAAALAFEHQDAADAGMLLRTEVLALAAAGDHDAALAARARIAARQAAAAAAGAAAAPEMDAIDEALFPILTARAPDTAFLRAVLPGAKLPPDLRGAVADAVARRLRDLGFGAAARDLLDAAGADTLARADAAVAAGVPRAALRLVAGRDDADAAAVRGAALQDLGQYPAAADAFRSAGDTAAAAAAAWSGRDWALFAEIAGASPAMPGLAPRLSALEALGFPGTTGVAERARGGLAGDAVSGGGDAADIDAGPGAGGVAAGPGAGGGVAGAGAGDIAAGPEATAAVDQPGPDAEPAGQLAAARGLLERSGAVRAAARTLLAAPAIGTAPPPDG